MKALWSALLVLTTSTPLFAQRQHAPAPADTMQASTNDEMQPTTLPPLPKTVTVDMLVHGDKLFHGRGGCFACHGAEGQGLPAAGDAITTGLSFAQPEIESIIEVIEHGLSDALTRTPIRMPARGARGDLTDDELHALAAYVWAISQVHGEPWPGGHAAHESMLPPGATRGTAGLVQKRTERNR